MSEDEDKREADASTEEDRRIIIDDNFVDEYSSNQEVIKFIQKKFSRLSRKGAINLIKQILQSNIHIKFHDIVPNAKSFVRYNLSKFDHANGELKQEFLKGLKRELNGFLMEIGKEIPHYDENKHHDFQVEKIDGVDVFVIDKNTLYKKARKLVCDEGGDVSFKYNFDATDMNLTVPGNKETLQRCQIQLLSTSVKFDYPIEFTYVCPQCSHVTRMRAYETASTGNRIKCPGIFSYLTSEGEPRTRICGLPLAPDSEVSLTKDAYYYDISYEDIEGNKHTAGAISFNKMEPGFYESVLFKIKNPKKTELFQIMDVKPMKSNPFKFPDKITGENYVFTLQKEFDKFIKEKTGMEIYGLYPIKVGLIIQTVVNMLGLKLSSNVQIVGDASTGKSTILKYYGFLLNGHMNLSTNGLSISVAGLRGTKNVISLMGKDQKIITTGYLGTFRSIHIDEAGENRELIQNLKSFIFEDNYGYDKAGATGVFNKRTAHINISENLDFTHLGQYRGAIRKAYKDMTAQIGDEEKEPWDENWDLHLPLYMYDNPYLRKIIKEKRTEYRLKQQFWIDGYDYALHERFPFYFYLVNEKKDEALSEVVKGNVARDTISENLQLIKVLKSDCILQFFKELCEYKDSEDDRKNFSRVDTILEQYGIEADSRMKEFYYNFVKVSRIINKRNKTEEEDFQLLRWIIEKTNRKLDVADTADFKIVGPPDRKKEEEIDLKIEEETKETEDTFGLPDGEFE